MNSSLLEPDQGLRRHISPDHWFPFLLLILGILFFYDSLFSSRNFYFRDILNFHYPLRRLLIESYGRGELPLWNPYVYLGQPMLANPNYMAFYPTNLFHVFLPFNYAFKLHFIIHPLIAGLGAYFLQRRFGISPPAALGGSIVYQFSGTVLSFLNLFSIVQTVALLPWTGWAFLEGLHRPSRRRILLFGAILALQVITFEPLLLQGCLFLLTALGILHVLQSPKRGAAIRRILHIGCVGSMFALGLSAIQHLPTFELLPRSARWGGYDFASASSWSTHPADWANILIPNLFGDIYTMDWSTYWGEPFHDARGAYLVSSFLGFTAIILVVLSFMSHRRNLQKTLLGLLLVSALLSLGKYNPLYQWLWDNVLVFRLGRYPSKYMLLGTLALAILASLGLEVVLRDKDLFLGRRRRILAVGGAGLALAFVCLSLWLYVYWYPGEFAGWIRLKLESSRSLTKDFEAITSQLLSSLRYTGTFVLVGSVLVLLSAVWKRKALLVSLFLFLLVAEILPANLKLIPLIAETEFEFVPQINEFLRQYGAKAPQRVFSETRRDPPAGLMIYAPNRSYAWTTLFNRNSGQPPHGIINGIHYSVDSSIDGLNTRQSDEIWQAWSLLPEADGLTLMQKLNTPALLTFDKFEDARARLIAVFNTNSNLPVKLYDLEGALSRAVFVSGVRMAPSHTDAMYEFIRPEFSFKDTVILEDPGIGQRPPEPEAGTVEILEYESSGLVCSVNAKLPGYLVVLDTYYPGWQAWLDGEPVDILRANYTFRAVKIPAGIHRVEFRYRPKVFYVGLCLTGLTLALGLFSLFWPPAARCEWPENADDR